MKLMDKKLIKPHMKTDTSPVRKPRFQRTDRETSADRRSLSLSSKKSERSYNSREVDINPVQFVRPMHLDGSSYNSPLKHNETEPKLGLLIEARINSYRREVTPFKNQETTKQQQQQLMRPLQKALRRKKQLEQSVDRKQVQIAELEEQNQNLKARVFEFENLESEKRAVDKKCQRLETQLLEKQSKLTLLQNSLKQNQNCLTQTKSCLERLKKQIQQNRIYDLQKQNQLLDSRLKASETRLESKHEELRTIDVACSKLKKEIDQLNMKNQKLEAQLFARSYTATSLRQESLSKEVQALKDWVSSNREGHEKYLEGIIGQQKSDISQLKEENKILYIKLDVVVKKLHQKEKDSKKTKNKQLVELQAKFRKFLLEYRNFRKQHNDLLQKNISQTRIQNSGERWERHIDEDSQSLNYSLTPERSL